MLRPARTERARKSAGRIRAGRGVRRTAAKALAAAGVALALTVLPLLPAATASADSVRQQQQWVLDMLNVDAAWEVTEGSGVTVAVIDSGVDPNVADLTGSVTAGPDYTGVRTSTSNPNGGEQGTWMASITAGHGHAGEYDGIGYDGVVGVAPDS